VWAVGWVDIVFVNAWVTVAGYDVDIEGEAREGRGRWKDIRDMSFKVNQKIRCEFQGRFAHDLEFC
jgi:hypothetical protein